MGFWCTINKSYLNHTWSDSCSFSVVHCSGHPCCRWIIALSIPYNLMYKDATSTTTRRHSSGIYRSCCFWRISPKSNKNEGRMAIKCFNFLFNSYANVFQWAAYSRQFAFQGALICLCTVGNMSKSAIWEGISTLGILGGGGYCSTNMIRSVPIKPLPIIPLCHPTWERQQGDPQFLQSWDKELQATFTPA